MARMLSKEQLLRLLLLWCFGKRLLVGSSLRRGQAVVQGGWRMEHLLQALHSNYVVPLERRLSGYNWPGLTSMDLS